MMVLEVMRSSQFSFSPQWNPEVKRSLPFEVMSNNFKVDLQSLDKFFTIIMIVIIILITI
jgi:hypothetical protein